MKTCSRFVCLLLALALSFTLMGCHEKSEVVMKIGDVEISSGLYLAFQLTAYNEMRTAIDTELQNAATDTTGSVTSTYDISDPDDYFTVTYEGKTGKEYILAQAEIMAKEYAFVEQKFAEFELEFTKEDNDTIQDEASAAWEEGTSEYFEPNGVSYETYKTMVANTFKREKLFYYYYDRPDDETGKGGLKQVASADIAAAMGESYILVDYMPVSLVDETTYEALSDDEITAIKERVDGYAQSINDGDILFAHAYEKEMGVEPTANFENTGDIKSIYPTTAYPLYSASTDTYAAAIYNLLQPKTQEEGFSYETAYAIEDEDSTVYCLVVFYDISQDPLYLENYRLQVLVDLKFDDFESLVETESGKLTVTKTGSFDRYKPTNIKYDELYE